MFRALRALSFSGKILFFGHVVFFLQSFVHPSVLGSSPTLSKNEKKIFFTKQFVTGSSSVFTKQFVTGSLPPKGV